jgi:hypothetical protein
MAYLISSRSPSNLGAYRRVSPVPVHPALRVPIVAQPSRFRIGTRPVRTAPLPLRLGLGQDIVAGDALPLDTANFPGASASADLMPFAPTNYPPLPAQISSTYTVQPMSLDPLNFASPQAAIAAGADAQKTAAAWTKAVASFPTTQAALAAGIPAGVVTQLWAASRSAIPPPSGSWFDGSTFGIPNKFLAFGAGGLVLLGALGGKRRR